MAEHTECCESSSDISPTLRDARSFRRTVTWRAAVSLSHNIGFRDVRTR